MSIGHMKTYPVSMAINLVLPYNSETNDSYENRPEYNSVFIATTGKAIQRQIDVRGYITISDMLIQLGYAYNIYIGDQIVTSLRSIKYNAVKQEITICCSFDFKPEDIQKEERK